MDFVRPDRSVTVDPARRTRFHELLVFAVLAILVWPVAAVGVVGGYGFAVWMYQHIAGPPSGPRH
jgi:nitrate reductase NapE